MMNKLLGKTVKKVTLISAVLAIIFALAIVLTAILGINYGKSLENANTLTVKVNNFYFNDETKLSAVESVCETELDKLGINYEQKGEMSGDESEIVYYFDEEVNLTDAKTALQTAFAEMTKDGERFDGADTVDRFNEHTLPFAFCLIKFVQTPLERFDQTGDDQSHKQGVTQYDSGQCGTVKKQERHKNAQSENI